MAKTANIRLMYFDLKGSAEVARIILASTGKEFEDVRFSSHTSPEFQEMKPKLPMEQLPVLDVDGDLIPQSCAINTYLAREFGLYGKTPKDQLTIDIVVQVQKDISRATFKWFMLPEGDAKEAKKAEAKEETPKYLRYLESILQKNDNGYFVGNGVTLADIVMFDSLTGFNAGTIDWDEERYPWINRNKERVIKHWRIGQYINGRKDSPF